MSQVATALAERGIAIGAAVPRTGGLLEFTAPGVSAHETTAALDAVGIPVKVDEDLGSIAVVSLGISRCPAIIARADRAARGTHRLASGHDDARPVSVLVASKVLDEAVRVLHATFISVVPDPHLRVSPAA